MPGEKAHALARVFEIFEDLLGHPTALPSERTPYARGASRFGPPSGVRFAPAPDRGAEGEIPDDAGQRREPERDRAIGEHGDDRGAGMGAERHERADHAPF